ncbi:MAG: protein kinase domain-containing protein [Planctomycetota bacterium]|jgi:tetratricopeptide (TPR) repeat protein/tRNA A-37 threonylcarbamoyl transferase component Bud32
MPHDSLVGPAREDRYELLEEIARGGMGAIVKLVDNDIRRPVAMKVILGEDVKERVERFVEEAQVTGQLEHPNIVPVHELGLDPDGKVYFTMKLVKGESLDAIIDAVADKDPEALREYPLSHLLQIFLKVCDAMAFAHSKGVIHRDLKPENVMVGRFGEVLVMDWGLAKVKGREDTAEEALVETIRSEKEVGKTLTGDVMGTPSYMPPEQASGEVDRIDERSDVFALGAMLYKILTHEAPYTGGHVTEVLKKAVQCTVKAPRVRSPWNRIPRELQAVCLKAMSGRMADRYGSVEALAEDIRAFLDHRRVSAHRSGLVTRCLRFMQRHPAGSLTGGVALVLLTFGGALTGVLLQRAEAERAKAREKEAQAEAEGARAEAASVRAQLAEEARKRAEVRATDAEDALKKGRLVSAVLRSAEVELGDVHRKIRRLRNTHPSAEEIARQSTTLWGKVEIFERNVPGDTASQAAWFAAKGWLRWLAMDHESAFALFETSRELDPDVAYGYLFEGLCWLFSYIGQHGVPRSSLGRKGSMFVEYAPETDSMKKARLRFEALLEPIRKARVWGEAASEDFRQVFDGILALQEGKLEAALVGLNRGLSMAEMVWLRNELLLIRAVIRHYLLDIEGGLADVDEVLAEQPDKAYAHSLKGNLLTERGVAEEFAGKDGRETLKRAIRSFKRARAKSQGTSTLGNRLGSLHWLLGEAERNRGRDPRKHYQEALEEYSAAIPNRPTWSSLRTNRGNVYYSLGELAQAEGGDPFEHFQRAIEEYEKAIEINPREPTPHLSLGSCNFRLGKLWMARGEDPRPFLRRAIEHLDRSQAINDRNYEVFLNKAQVLSLLAANEASRGSDASSWFEKALHCTERGFQFDPGNPDLHVARSGIYCDMGESLKAQGKDPTEAFEKAVQDAEAAVQKSPRNTATQIRLSIACWYRGNNRLRRREEAAEDFQKALEAAEACLRLRPGDAPAVHLKGNALMGLGLAKKAAGEDPHETFLAALREFATAIERNPNLLTSRISFCHGLIQLARSQEERGENPRGTYEQLVRACTETLKRAPGDFKTLEIRSRAHCILGERMGARGEDPTFHFQRALEDAESALQRNPHFLDAVMRNAEASLAMGEFLAMRRGRGARRWLSKAIDEAEHAIRLNPDRAEPYNIQGRAYGQLGNLTRARGGNSRPDYEKSVRAYGEALRREPRNPMFYGNRGGALTNLAKAVIRAGGDPRPLLLKAVRDYEKALALKPNHVLTCYNRGITLGILGAEQALRGDSPVPDYEKGVASYTAALKRNPAHWQSLANLGKLLECLGRFEASAKAYEKSLACPGALRDVIEKLLKEARAAASLPPWAQAFHHGELSLRKGQYAYAQEAMEKGFERIQGLGPSLDLKARKFIARAHLNLARIHALASSGKTAKYAEVKPLSKDAQTLRWNSAIENLRKSLELDGENLDRIKKSPDLIPLHDLPAYRELMKSWETRRKK